MSGWNDRACRPSPGCAGAWLHRNRSVISAGDRYPKSEGTAEMGVLENSIRGHLDRLPLPRRMAVLDRSGW